MPRRIAVLIAAVALTTPGVGVSSQTPSPAAPAAPGTPNTAPAVTLSAEPARKVFGTGEPFLLVANATDDADAVERLTFVWTIKNLESGVERPARSTALRQARAVLDLPGKYEVRCRVSDSAGAASEDTLAFVIEDAGDPGIASVSFDETTAPIQHVTPYWREGFWAIRRGDWARLTVAVRNFIVGAHDLRVFVDGKPVAPWDPNSAWGVQNLGGTSTDRRLRLFVPADAATGTHAIAVAVFRRGTGGNPDTETGRAGISPDPIVLFNPWRSAVPDASVYASTPLPNDQATFYTRSTQGVVIDGLASESVVDLTPHDKGVVTQALGIVSGLPQESRADASRVAAGMLAAVAGEPSLVLTRLLRSIGIPAREVSFAGAGRDLGPGTGTLQAKYECQRWSGARCATPQPVSTPEHRSRHTLTEIWSPSTQSWSAVDATALQEMTRLPWEISWKAQDNSWFKASGTGAMATNSFVSKPGFQRSDESRAFGLIPDVSVLKVVVEPVLTLNSSATIRISGTGAAPGRLGVAIVHLSTPNNGPSDTGAAGALTFASVVEPKGTGAWATSLSVPGDVFSRAGGYEIVVAPQEGSNGPSARARVDVRGLPIAIAIPARTQVGASFPVSARLVNSTNTAITAAALRLVLPAQFKLAGGSDSASLGVLAPGADLRVDAMVQALAPGTFLAAAVSEGSTGRAEAHVPVTVSGQSRVFVAGEPALGVTVGAAITVTADVMLDAIEASGKAEVELGPMLGPEVTILSDARKSTDSLTPDDRWTPSWQIQVNTPGTYRLPVRVGVAAVGEARSEVVLVAGANDPDLLLTNDFEEEGSLGYRSIKAMAGVALAVVAMLMGAVYWTRRRGARGSA